MNLKVSSFNRRAIRGGLGLFCAFAIGRGDALAFVLLPSASPQTSAQAAAAVPAAQLDSLVAPIALYPDPLLAQVLAASTYPLEIVQLQQWLAQNSGLSGQALSQAVAKQPWDASVQAMAAFPDVVKNMATNIQWTTDLGNAFLAQESGVMDAVQRMRARAQNTGNLQTTPQQVVDTEMVDNRPIVTIQQADPQVVYVPSYDPTVVYGAAPAYYPYPEYGYSYPSGYWAGRALAFGTGIALGSWWGGGGWGWRPGWGRGDIDINRNNAFVRNSNFYRGATGNVWRHNAAHRGNVAYGNRATAARYGGTFAGAGAANRAAGARQQLNRQGGNLASQRGNFANQRGSVGTAGRTGNFAGQRGNIGAANRAAGTTGRSYSGQRAGGVNRGAVGTTGMQNRAGTINRGNYGGGYNRGNYNRGNYSGNLNRGNYSRNLNRGNYGSINRGNFGGSRGSFKGGGRSFGGGGRSFGGGGRRGGGGGRGRR
ncbi:MAG TPA: DUF3300 domain-containing protein [Vicinamibacterales bacterium]